MELRYILLFIMPLAGGLIALKAAEVNRNQLKLFLAFSGAFLFSVTILEILPSLYLRTNNNSIGLFVLAGFFFQVFLEQLTQGVEHGHIHRQKDKGLPLMIIFGLCLHSFIEGMPIGNASFLSNEQRTNLVYGIALHEAPAAFTLITLLRYSNTKNTLLITILMIYSLMSLFGIWSSNLLVKQLTLSSSIIEDVLAIVIGTFLHISTTILFENSEHHSFGRYRLITVIIGVGLAVSVINFHLLFE